MPPRPADHGLSVDVNHLWCSHYSSSPMALPPTWLHLQQPRLLLVSPTSTPSPCPAAVLAAAPEIVVAVEIQLPSPPLFCHCKFKAAVALPPLLLEIRRRRSPMFSNTTSIAAPLEVAFAAVTGLMPTRVLLEPPSSAVRCRQGSPSLVQY